MDDYGIEYLDEDKNKVPAAKDEKKEEAKVDSKKEAEAEESDEYYRETKFDKSKPAPPKK